MTCHQQPGNIWVHRGDGRMLLVEAPCEVTKPGAGVQCRLGVMGFSSSGRSSSSCIMVQARWALTLILLLVALPAQDVGAAPWRAQAVGRWAGQGQYPALTDPDEQQQLGIQLTHFLSKAPEREAMPQEEAPQEGRQAAPVSEENTRAFHATSVSGNRCPLAIQRHLPRSPSVCRLCPGAAAAPCSSSQTVSAEPVLC